MRLHHRNISKVLFILLALTLSQCAKKTKSQDVVITVTPNQPIVFTSDKTIDVGGSAVTVKAPWFDFSVHIENKSDSAVTIIGVHIEVTGTNESNQSQTVMGDFNPSDNDVTLNDVVCKYGYFGTFEKSGVPGNSGNLHITSSTTGCISGTAIFTSANNPKPSSTNLIRYSVVIKPIGYFGSAGTPTDRFDNSATIYTQ
ncbi:MAG: hypothetical protein ACXVA9_07690 [Bdellovibrionales bacterium]